MDNAHYFLADNPDDIELERLTLLERLAHKWTEQTLVPVGDLSGKRCLEVGAGAGGVTRWLADKVGPTGSVVAVDKDPRFLREMPDNVEVIEADLTTYEPDGEFDVIHSRAVLIYVPDREQVVARLAGHLAMDGWLACEEVLFFSVAEFIDRQSGAPVPDSGALMSLFDLGGMDAIRFPMQLPVTFRGLGLVDVHAQVNADVDVGGSEWARLLTMTAADVAASMAVAFELAGPDFPDRLRETFADPVNAVVSPAFVAAVGRRPG